MSLATTEDRIVLFTFSDSVNKFNIKVVKRSTGDYILFYNTLQSEIVSNQKEIEYKIRSLLERYSHIRIEVPAPYPVFESATTTFIEMMNKGIIRIGFYLGFL